MATFNVLFAVQYDNSVTTGQDQDGKIVLPTDASADTTPMTLLKHSPVYFKGIVATFNMLPIRPRD
jgi:hypothetical protein